MSYTVKRTAVVPQLRADWNDPVWSGAETATLTHVQAGSSDHVPPVAVRLLHDERNVYGIFQVKDRYVRSVCTQFQDQVCRDSCVEFFFRPNRGKGYFNLEMNAGGTFLIYYVRDHSRKAGGFADFSKLTPGEGAMIKVVTDQPRVIDPEISAPLTWCAQFALPADLLDIYAGNLGSLNGVSWQGNFYKCADGTSHPHWVTWNPITVKNYHLPECFAELKLA